VLNSAENIKGWTAVAFILLIYIFLCFGLDDLLRNSSFSLDLKDISKVGAKSVIGLLIVYCLSMTFYLFSRTAGFFIHKFNKFSKGLFIAVGTIFVFLLEQSCMDRFTAMILAALFAAYLSLLFFYFGGKARSNPFANFILPMVWMAVFVTVVFNNAGYLREKEERKLIAIQLATEKNPVTELLYNKLEHKLLSDSVIIAMTRDFNASKDEALIRRINSGYIRDFWNRFTVQITVCPPGKMLKIQPRGYVYNCEQYFQQVCDKVGEKTSNPNLFYLDYGTGIETYLGILKPHDSVKNSNAGEVKIYIEFTAKTPSKDMGYPELLIDRRIMNIPDLGSYSYGMYQNAYLVYKTGKYSYPMNLSNLIRSSDSSSFVNSDGMNHYRYTLDKSRELLVSKKNDSFLGLISPVSYLFIMFSLLTLFLNFAYRPSMMKEFSFITLKNRFQIANVGMIVVSFLILGCLLLYFLIRLNNLKNMDSFSERTLSVMLEMQEKFGEKDKLDKHDNPALEEDLQRLSGMFYTDVNVYSIYGKLILSSRPQVFDEGLISGRMNIGAYTDLKRNKQSAFFQDEKIGAYDYISAYFPLLNDRNELLAYINLPFFSRQEDLRKEINDFLIAFMNLYILFILISIFISFAISRYLSAPLGILVSRMEGFQLGKRNEKINWYHQDEIGRLVEEYNRLIDELAFSADQLAKSERETAWREMARQVAHEIKNPLTPMKLSVQHLRKTWDEQSGDFNQRIQRFTKIMTEQIDSLSAIATEFSDFAKMPLPVSEELDLIEILSSVVSMYTGLENIEIRLETSENQAKIKGDKRQIVRVFTNLLNNAAQAISNKEKGLIKISVYKKGKNYSVDIEDNGNGIPDELAEMIFLPNFTTKSGGAGLGLAIVKGIIINMGGDITFVSLKNGTVFTINIPVFNDTLSA
jgi:signal transduction histidine kinase